jgi:5-oxoprolinase (ATP-hydrolysing)
MPQDPIEKRKPNQEKPIPQTRQIFTDEGWSDAQIFDRAALLAEDKVNGPALIIEPHTTIVIEPGWQAELTATNNVVLTRVKAKKRGHAIGTKVDPVMLEIFNNLFMSIAEQMGYTLEKTASSVNIKERLDFSCAIFDWDGSLIANAPHMPVHLGSMSVSVKTIIEQNQNKINKGDVFVLNAPYNGGTHLPDVTVIAPVFDQAGADVLFFTGARGHHADIGGISPGSMPPMSRNVKEEGVLINNFKLIEGGKLREKDFIELLTTAPHPARNVLQNLADLKAQIAACEKGAQELTAMVADYGLDVVKAYMGHIQDNAEECVRRVIDVLSDSEFALPLDNGAEIKVTIRVNKINRAATIDFTGTSDQLEDNFNAPTAVARAVVLYVFRCMIADDIPLNDGCLKPLDIVIAEGSMLRPNYPAAVVAGNVETSQHLTDALFGALGVMAAAQGTMNNLTFGNETYQYYETICGGSGAGKMFDGTDAIHTHMTNSRLTDPEVLEWRLPVLLQSFEIRAGSGGAGRHKGGNGTVRRLTFRKPMKVSVLSTRRKTEPFGIVGGKAGKCGCNWIQRADGSIETLRGCDTTEAAAGDTIIIETPGGGGYGHC